MSRIEVVPTTLTDAAERLRAATLDARRIRSALHDAGPEATGSDELTAALREHAEAWGWSLEQVHTRVREVVRALGTAATVYDEVERAVGDAAG